MTLADQIQNLATRVGAEIKAVRKSTQRKGSESSIGTSVSVGATRLPINVDGQYSGFPSITQLTDGRLIMVWYQATNHLAARDGKVMASISSDRGKTWGTAVIASGSGDCRDPGIRLIAGKLYLTYFKGTAINAADGCYLRISSDDGATWGAEIRIDSGMQYAAMTAPIVDLGDGRLMAVIYGKTLTSDARESSWSSISTDGGLTWSAPVKRVDGIALGFSAPEPWLSKFGNTLVMTYRVNTLQDLGRIVSTDNGATWSAHQTIVTGGTGRPTTAFASDGTLLLAYRSLTTQQSKASGMLRYSRDNGATWSGARVLEQGNPAMWLYSDFLELDPGVFLVPSAIEETTTSSRISCRTVVVGAGRTAFGDSLSRPLASLPDIMDDFDRPDSSTVGLAATGQRWTADSGLTIKDGTLSCTGTGAAGFKYALMDAKSVNLEIEAEMAYTVGSGLGIVFRWVDSANHLYVCIETNGVNFRLYSRASGTATVLQQAAFPLNVGVYHRIRVVDNGGVIRIFADDALVLTHVLAAGSSSICGLQATTNSAGAVHSFRRFSVSRRGGLA